jgi:hypothetical protein
VQQVRVGCPEKRPGSRPGQVRSEPRAGGAGRAEAPAPVSGSTPALTGPAGRFDDAGMSTAEYAVGTVAACGFAGVLWAVVNSPAVRQLMQSVLERALNLTF